MSEGIQEEEEELIQQAELARAKLEMEEKLLKMRQAAQAKKRDAERKRVRAELLEAEAEFAGSQASSLAPKPATMEKQAINHPLVIAN